MSDGAAFVGTAAELATAEAALTSGPTALQQIAIRHYANLPPVPGTEATRFTGRTVMACARHGWLTVHQEQPYYRVTPTGLAAVQS